MRGLWVMAVVLGLAAMAEAAPRRQPVPAASEFRAALAPYLANGPTDSGWVLAGEPQVTEPRPGTLSVRLPGLAYTYPVASGPLTVDFGAIEGEAVRDGEAWRVTLGPAHWISITDAAGTVAEASFSVEAFSGRWLPGREAFESLEVRLHDLRYRLRNGDTHNIAQVIGRFDTAAGPGTMTGAVKAVGFAATSGRGALLGQAETANLNLALRQSDLTLGWEHTRRLDGDGMAAELTPLRLGLSGVLNPFPWEAMLRRLPGALVELADAPDEGRVGLLRSVWDTLRPVLHRAETRARDVTVRANSANLSASGQGEAFFSASGGQTGKLVVDVRGINERIAALTHRERQRHPMLFPSLALMTVLGDPVRDGRQRWHRYIVDLVEGGLRLNGADIAAIKPPTP